MKRMTKKEKTTDQLLTAVGNYITAHDGDPLVAGNIGILQESEFRFKLFICVTGKPPIKAAA